MPFQKIAIKLRSNKGKMVICEACWRLQFGTLIFSIVPRFSEKCVTVTFSLPVDVIDAGAACVVACAVIVVVGVLTPFVGV